ncbi:MAG: polysaccharide export protein [Deltaproteobacteria bacterium]|nr:polysaccharide export protein [Deltaproteobacteria bacterium]
MAAACATPTYTGDTKTLSVGSAPRVSDELSVGDVVEVRVFGEKDLSNAYQIDAEGTIFFPLIGKVKLTGLTPNQASQEIIRRLKDGYIREPHVSVFVKEAQTKMVSVLGEVQKPGNFPFVPNMTITQAIAAAGGFTKTARKNLTYVTRRIDGTEKRIEVPAEAVSQGRAQNFYLKPGDIIFVAESPI